MSAEAEMQVTPLVLRLTDEQAADLRGALDLALKAGGLQVAAKLVAIDALVLAAAAERDARPTGKRR